MRQASPILSVRASLGASLATSLAMTLVMSACATKPFPAERDGEEKVCVVVENRHFNNVKIYAERDGVRHRLGTVEGLSTENFRIPRRVLAGAWNFRLIADPIASPEVAETHGLEKIPGCHIHWQLAPNLYASQVISR